MGVRYIMRLSLLWMSRSSLRGYFFAKISYGLFEMWLLVTVVITGCLAAPGVALCRCMPGDLCWPTSAEWDRLNQTLDGSLIRNVPIASPCHGLEFDAVACQALRDVWTKPETQSATSQTTPIYYRD